MWCLATYNAAAIELLQRQLVGKAWWCTSELPAAMALEAAYPAILEELRALLSSKGKEATKEEEHHCHVDITENGINNNRGFIDYRSPVVDRGAWSDFQLYASCRRDAAHTARCPKTASLIASQPSLNSMIFGSHFFSRLAPGRI